MLALVSTSTATRCWLASVSFAWAGCRQNGRENASANSTSANPRSANSSQCSIRLRRVMRGGDGDRNINELNGVSPRGVPSCTA